MTTEHISHSPSAAMVDSQGIEDLARLPLAAALSSPWTFLQPTTELHSNTVGSAKYFLDSLAISVNNAQTTPQHNNKKRKRPDVEQDPLDRALQLKQLYVEGFTPDQIWEQAVRILDFAGHKVVRDYAHTGQRVDQISRNARSSVHFDNADSENKESEHSDTTTPIEDSTEQSSVDSDDDVDMESVSEAEDLAQSESDMQSNTEKEFDEDGDSVHSDNESKHDIYTQDPFGLNDGFFSIDDFNRQSELLEKQDAKGGAAEDFESDEEDIDWDANPLIAGNAKSFTKSSLSNDPAGVEEDDNTSDSEEEGPTFGNADLHGPSDSEDDGDTAYEDGGDSAGWINTSDIKYSDFFAPPARKVTAKSIRPLPKTQPDPEILENDVGRAMADVRRDLFGDGGSVDDDGDVSDDNANETQTQHSTHEKQRARIADEIRRLEAANIAKKEWMLAGEARAVERPVNSLIEEDLDFERIGKPVPVVTAEVSEDIEELVKRRILAKEFDEVIRRRPGVSDGQEKRRAKFELDDNKPQQSLAESYEADHLRATDPNYADPKDQKLMREHAEITNLWKEISSQLDTLSNWHYKPKAPQASINTVTDVATIMMEEARPTVSGAVNESAALAPQEVYAPGDDGKPAGELVLKSGASISKEEMTREEKAKVRRQRKKTQKQANGDGQAQTGRTAERQQLVSDLKKGGVKVIGKQGEVTDIHGNVNRTNTKSGADILKL